MYGFPNRIGTAGRNSGSSRPAPRAAASAFLSAAFFFWGAAPACRAQPASRQPAPALSFRYADPDSANPSGTLKVRVEIAPGWHINSDAPLDEFLVPTSVEAKAEGRAFGKPKYPAPQRVRSDAAGGDMLLFSGTFEVVVPVLKPSPAARPGKTPPRTRVLLRYQACDHSTCFPPKEIAAEG